VFTVAGPKDCSSGAGAGGDEGISKLYAMTFCVFEKIGPGMPRDGCGDGDAGEGGEEVFEKFVFGWAGSSPEFGQTDW